MKQLKTRAVALPFALGVLLTAALVPGAAFAQSVDPNLFTTPSDLAATSSTASAFFVDQSSATLLFGNGVTGQSVPTGSSVAASYASGSGASGNVPSDPWLACLIWTC